MKTRTYSIYLAGLLTIILFSQGCKKAADIVQNAGSQYYVKFKVDGNEVKYTYTAGSLNGNITGGGYSGGVVGQKAEFAGDKNAFAIDIATANPVVANTTYTNYQTSAGGYVKASLCLVAWYDANGNFFASWGEEFASTGVISDTKVKFTGISSSSLKGTFSGTAYRQISGTAEKHVITEGEFFVQR